MSDPWIAVVAAAVGASASLIGQWAAHFLAGRRDRKADERRLRDAQSERLREGYAWLVQASLALRQIIGEL